MKRKRWHRLDPRDNPYVLATANRPKSFRCPRCGMESFHPQDVKEGYCGNCHDWTGK